METELMKINHTKYLERKLSETKAKLRRAEASVSRLKGKIHEAVK